MSAADQEALAPRPGECPTAGPVVDCYVAIGDSFSAGSGCQPGERWTELLAERLRRANPGLTHRNFAVEGARSAEVRNQVGAALQLEPDLVSVVCGVNDALLSTRPDPLRYSRNLNAIFGSLRRTLPEVEILTATAPERWSFLGLRPRSAARLERAVERLNTITRSLAASHGVRCLEISGDAGIFDAANFSGDGLHPSPAGHAKAAIAFERLLAEPRRGAAR